MSCHINTLKWILAILNVILSLLGLSLIALSVYELNSTSIDSLEHIAVVLQIFVGSLVILTSFLGCYGTCRKSMGLICSYGICLLILLVFQIYIVIVAHMTDYAQEAANEFNHLWGNHTIYIAQISKIQQEFQCCGKSGSRDYIIVGRSIPLSCYIDFKRDSYGLFANGCLEPLQAYAIETGDSNLYLKWSLFLIELLSLGIAICWGMNIHHLQRRAEY